MWGCSPPLDLRDEICKTNSEIDEKNALDILIVGAGDVRHIVKTLGFTKRNPEATINFHCIELSSENIARSILLLNICLKKDLGLQESCRYYLEILGNTLITPGTAKFLIETLYELIDAITQTIPCPWLSLDSLRYRDRDSIVSIMKFWIRAICEGIPIVQYWDRRMRKALGTRYDYREGVFDWDYHMVLKSRNISHLTLHEYRFWRNNGIAFTWLETDPSRSNPTLINNVSPYGKGFIHSAYNGDITNGPYLTWAQDEPDKNDKLRATDKAEGQIMKALYRIREGGECPENMIAAHRDQSILNGTLVSEMPDIGIEQESWIPTKRSKMPHDPTPWIDLEDVKVIFHSAKHLERYKNKIQWREIYDVAFVAHNMINHLINIIPLMRNGAIIVVESRKFLVDVREEQQDQFAKELLKIANDNGLKEFEPFNPHNDDFCRLIKNDSSELVLQ